MSDRPIVFVEPNTANCVRISIRNKDAQIGYEIIAAADGIIVHANGNPVEVRQ